VPRFFNGDEMKRFGEIEFCGWKTSGDGREDVGLATL
jgi:hypothetical protein